MLYSFDLKDFDSSVHTQYVAKWMHYLQLDFPKFTLTQVEPLPVFTFLIACHMLLTLYQNMHYLQRKFERLLMEWKPRNFSPMDVEMEPDDRVC